MDIESKRLSRGLETRATDRKKERVEYDMGYVSSTHIPEHVKKEDHDYYWERTSIRGQIDSALDGAIRKGWKPVPIDRDGGRFSDILERNPLSRKFICQGDVILLEREKELSVKEKEQNDKISMDRLTSSPAYNYKNHEKNNIGTVR